MKLTTVGRWIALGAALALLPDAAAMGAVNAYMTIENTAQGAVKGGDSARVAAPGGPIQLTSIVHMPKEASSGMATGRREMSSIVVMKKIDKASPIFSQAMSRNEPLHTVTIVFEGAGQGAGKAAQKIVLSDATVADIKNMGATESIKLTYQKIEVTYTNSSKSAMDDWETPR